MSDAFWSSFFTSMPVLVISFATLATALGGLYMQVKTANKLADVHKEINGRMTQLVELTASSAKAEGVKQELDRNKG